MPVIWEWLKKSPGMAKLQNPNCLANYMELIEKSTRSLIVTARGQTSSSQIIKHALPEATHTQVLMDIGKYTSLALKKIYLASTR